MDKNKGRKHSSEYFPAFKPTCILRRNPNNPILKPIPENQWESQYVFNTAALHLDGRVHLLYRAIGNLGLSVLGYAASKDGMHIDERFNEPAYICPGSLRNKSGKEVFQPFSYSSGGSFSGCEDPRITKIDDKIYMTYTSFAGWNLPPGVALTSISVEDFLKKKWHWQPPVLISSSGEIHKNWVIFPEKINGKFAVLHSISPNILIEYLDTLDFHDNAFITSNYQSSGRAQYWDTWVRGVGPPPMKTKEGWLVLYHAMDMSDPNRYKIGAMVLDGEDLTRVLYRSKRPLLEPEAPYENEGHKAGVVYCCGAFILESKLFVYYGGADTVLCGAWTNLDELREHFENTDQS